MSGLLVFVLLEGVFDFLAGLLEIGFDLMAFTLGLEPVVAGGVTGAFLGLVVEVPGSVVDDVPKPVAVLQWQAVPTPRP